MKHAVFFGEKGLTSTSANHLANMAKEFVKREETEVSNIAFISERVSLMGSCNTHQLKVGVTTLSDIPAKLDKIAKANSLIAWLREAIKAKKKLNDTLRNLSLEEFCSLKGTEFPTHPIKDATLTEEEYYDNLPISTRNRYFQLETMCAVIGKYIHPGGELATQRETLMKTLSNPTKVAGNGRDTLIYEYTPSIKPEDVDKMFYDLQDCHRESQKALNSIKFECEKAILESQTSANAKYLAEVQAYNATMENIRAEFRKYVTEQTAIIGNLKIIIPDSLSDIYETINNLGK